MKQKVLVGCPTSELKGYALERYVKGVKSLKYGKFDVLIVDNSRGEEYCQKINRLGLPAVRGPYSKSARQRIVDSRNILRQKVLDEGYDYFFSLEQDVIPPTDALQNLLNHGKDIVTGVYFSYQTNNGVTLLVPLLWQKVKNDEMRFMLEKEVTEQKLLEVGACGLGCILIHRDVLEKIKFRFNKEDNSFDDMWFCKDASDAGFKIFADTSIKCKHLIKDWRWDGINK
ncbi:hypothetical protein FJZ53_02375 [Candidatus Woesearchaeota archaeon]|nr:hypothetical protein [Candidatus Woesearchaeota archaeon]